MMPYTRETLDMIRATVRAGAPPQHVCERTGWGASRFESVCRLHGIEAPLTPYAPAPSPAQQRPAAVANRRPNGRVGVTVRMSLDLLMRLDHHARERSRSTVKHASRLIDDYLQWRGGRWIVISSRRPSRNMGCGRIRIRLSGEAAKVLAAEAKLRGKGASVGLLVKGILAELFESQSGPVALREPASEIAS